MKLLLVDDESDFLELGKLFLEKEHRFDVKTAISAEEALEKLDGGDYDAIISDYDMPEMNGLEFFETLRVQGTNLPFIIITGCERDEIEEEAATLGVDRFLRKGRDPREMFSDLADVVAWEVGCGAEKDAGSPDRFEGRT